MAAGGLTLECQPPFGWYLDTYRTSLHRAYQKEQRHRVEGADVRGVPVGVASASRKSIRTCDPTITNTVERYLQCRRNSHITSARSHKANHIEVPVLEDGVWVVGCQPQLLLLHVELINYRPPNLRQMNT